jgi:hypothetical protein
MRPSRCRLSAPSLAKASLDRQADFCVLSCRRPSQHNLFDSQIPGQRMVDSLDDELPPSHQSAGEAFADSQQSIEDTLDNAQVEADLLLEAAGRIPVTAAAAKKGKGKSRKAVLARRQAVEEVVVQETTEVMELAEAMPPQDEMEEGIIDPSLEAEGSGSQSLEYATQDEVAAAAVQASYVDSQESLISSLGAENLWNDFRLQGLPVNEVRPMALLLAPRAFNLPTADIFTVNGRSRLSVRPEPRARRPGAVQPGRVVAGRPAYRSLAGRLGGRHRRGQDGRHR